MSLNEFFFSIREKEKKFRISCFEDEYVNKMAKTKENLLKYQKKLFEIDDILKANPIGDYQVT
jgi:glutamine phosphoribosylpyrophosphate amidotransferase